MTLSYQKQLSGKKVELRRQTNSTWKVIIPGYEIPPFPGGVAAADAIGEGATLDDALRDLALKLQPVAP